MSQINKSVINPHEIEQKINNAIETLKTQQEATAKIVELQSELMEKYINDYISKMPSGKIIHRADSFTISKEKRMSGLPEWFLNLDYEDGSCYEFIDDPHFQLAYISTYTTGQIDDHYVRLTVQYKFTP